MEDGVHLKLYDQIEISLPRFFIERNETSVIRAYMDSDIEQPLFIVGPAGMGKTTLLLAEHFRCVDEQWNTVWSIRTWDFNQVKELLPAASSYGRGLVIVDDMETWPSNRVLELIEILSHVLHKSGGKFKALLAGRRVLPELAAKVRLIRLGPLSPSECDRLLAMSGIPTALQHAIGGNPLTISLLRKLSGSLHIPMEALLDPDVLLGARSTVHATKSLWVPPPKSIERVRDFSDQLFQSIAADPTVAYSLTARQFEEFIADLWKRMGWVVELTKKTRDGGADIIAVRDDTGTPLKVLIEAKRYSPDRPVSVGIVRQLFAVKETRGANKAVLATTSYFTSDARREFTQFVPYVLDFHDLHTIHTWVKQSTAQNT